jgi:hypothetical protein
MKWLNCVKIRLVLVVFVAATMPSGGSAYADFTFSTPIEVGPPIWSPGHDSQGCCFSRDGLELYFSSDRPGGYGFFDIWVATRETVDASWTGPVNLGPNVNGPEGEIDPAISPDGLELYFGIYSESPYRIRMCSRPSKDAPWSNPKFLNPPVGDYEAFAPEVSADGLSLYFTSGQLGVRDIFVTTRATNNEDDWGTPVNLGPTVNSSSYEGYPSISSDGLCLFFASDRPGGYDEMRELLPNWAVPIGIWVTTRPTKDAEWDPPVNYPSLIQSGYDFAPAISPDGSVLYFDSIFTKWQSSITPIVDLNGDKIVDSADMCIMVDHWGTDEPLCDIGPMPWGDGIVDVQDLIVLAEHLFEETGLVAYWKLDEDEGDIAYNSISDNHGILSGNPTWQPDSGQVAGALKFDGIDDYISTDFVLNPNYGPFSVFAWIRDGAPGQVIISQQSMADWLITDAEGNLMTELKCTGRSAGYLFSESVITDGQWHRIGLVWDGSHRMLYVDGVVVAEDTQHVLVGSEMGLYIGAGQALDSSTFFSGLIDDVRIYNCAVKR